MKTMLKAAVLTVAGALTLTACASADGGSSAATAAGGTPRAIERTASRRSDFRLGVTGCPELGHRRLPDVDQPTFSDRLDDLVVSVRHEVAKERRSEGRANAARCVEVFD